MTIYGGDGDGGGGGFPTSAFLGQAAASSLAHGTETQLGVNALSGFGSFDSSVFESDWTNGTNTGIVIPSGITGIYLYGYLQWDTETFQNQGDYAEPFDLNLSVTAKINGSAISPFPLVTLKEEALSEKSFTISYPMLSMFMEVEAGDEITFHMTQSNTPTINMSGPPSLALSIPGW